MIIADARRIWARRWGAPWQQSRPRRDMGKRKAGKTGTEADLLRKRRASVAMGSAGTCARTVPKQELLDRGLWTEKHEKESKFQSAKSLGIKAEALRAGVLLEEEIDCAVEETAEQQKDREQTSAAKRRRVDDRVSGFNRAATQSARDWCIANTCKKVLLDLTESQRAVQ